MGELHALILGKRWSSALFMFAALWACSLPAFGAGSHGPWAVGVNYPGLGLRYFLNDSWAVEAKGQFESSISVLGLRSYLYFDPHAHLPLFAGFEADYLSFKGEVSEGAGWAAEVFVGVEYFLTKSFSFQMDIGPAWISLQDRNYPVSVSGIEYVVNFGLNVYF